jgi:hypothetical protein
MLSSKSSFSRLILLFYRFTISMGIEFPKGRIYRTKQGDKFCRLFPSAGKEILVCSCNGRDVQACSLHVLEQRQGWF